MASAQNHSSLRSKARPAARYRRHQEGRAAQRTALHAPYDFLNHSFSPIIGRELSGIGNPKTIERQFFASVANLCTVYKLQLPCFDTAAYPSNIVQAYQWIQEQLRKVQPGLQLIIVNKGRCKACLTTVKEYNTGTWLYYIPVEPLHLLWSNRKQRARRNLILSLFAYLYQVVGMPYFRSDFLGDTYEMIENWYEDDPTAFDEEEYQEVREELKALKFYGGKLFESIRHPYHISQFENRVNSFQPSNEVDMLLLEICDKFLLLYKQYPDRSIFDNMPQGLLSPEDEERIHAHQYISFFWKSTGLLYSQLMDSINMQFQEIGYMENPVTFQFFDTPQTEERHNLDFETRIFDLLAQLADVLMEL